jgi:hypothetical protein
MSFGIEQFYKLQHHSEQQSVNIEILLLMSKITDSITNLNTQLATIQAGITAIQAKLANTNQLTPEDQASLDASISQAADIAKSITTLAQ